MGLTLTDGLQTQGGAEQGKMTRKSAVGGGV